MTSIFLLLIIAACAILQYFKGTFIKACAAAISAIIAGIVSLGYFEPLAAIFLRKTTNLTVFTFWIQPICAILLFILSFTVLMAIVTELTKKKVDLGNNVEQVGRIVFGIILGFVISGFLLSTLSMMPMSAKQPYQRFDLSNPNVEKPAGSLLNADGFAIGWVNMASAGSLSGKQSFAVLHADFLNQSFLNRNNFKTTNDILPLAIYKAIEIPPKSAVWPASEDIKAISGQVIPIKADHGLTVVRIGFSKYAMGTMTVFTPSQLRIVCKHEKNAKKPLKGRGKAIYPIGYMEADNQIQLKKLNESITFKKSDIPDKTKWIDFVFAVPNGFVPVLAEFKQDNAALLPSPTPSGLSPEPIPFSPPPPPKVEDVNDVPADANAVTENQ